MKQLFQLLILLGVLTGAALHAEEEGFVDKAGRTVKKGAEATAKGIEKGAEATARGVNKGVEATGRVAKKADTWIDSKLNKGGAAKEEKK